MSNDASSSFTGPSASYDTNASQATAPPGADPATSDDDEARLNLRAHQRRRAYHLDDLIRSIDIAIYCQLSILYYMDCSLLRFLLRAIPHWLFFTPKPAFLPAPPSHRPFLDVILFINLIALSLHLLLAQPEAGESMRGYLHGGLLIDFVGELGPISKFRLALFDLIVMALQFIMLPAVLARRELKGVIEGSLASTNRRPSNDLGSMHTRRDIDAEEQGIRRDNMLVEEGIELEPLRNDMEYYAEFNSSTRHTEHHLDAFNSGQLVIVDLHVVDTIRTLWRQRIAQAIGS